MQLLPLLSATHNIILSTLFYHSLSLCPLTATGIARQSCPHFSQHIIILIKLTKFWYLQVLMNSLIFWYQSNKNKGPKISYIHTSNVISVFRYAALTLSICTKETAFAINIGSVTSDKVPYLKTFSIKASMNNKTASQRSGWYWRPFGSRVMTLRAPLSRTTNRSLIAHSQN